MSDPEELVENLAGQLARHDSAVPASVLRRSRALPDEPGLYAWWADAAGHALLSCPFGEPLPALIYAGQAGASSARTAKTGTATLRSRILSNHLGGNISSSTFRLTLCAILRDPLGLHLAANGRLEPSANVVLSDWMHQHLSIGWVAHPDRTTLARLEGAVLHLLDPPLNLQGMKPTPIRRRLGDLRAGLRGSPPSRRVVSP